MFIVILAAFIAASFLMAQRYDRDMITVVPVTTVILVFILYILAFFRALGAIDYIAAGLLILMLIFFFRKDRYERKKLMLEFGHKVIQPEIILLAVLSVLLFFLEKDRIFTWWDDINFWATDTKSLYYLGGFAGKYGNVSPSFGDYPQGLELFKWLFLHISPDRYIEGLQFAGYYVLNLIFLIPIAHKAPPKIRPFMTSAVILIPGVADGIHFGGTCADVTMGIVYGALLVDLFELAFSENERNDSFSLIRITCYAVFLSSVKQVGVQWAFLAFVFWLLVCRRKFNEKIAEVKVINENALKSHVWVPVTAVIVYLASWLSFCLIRRRVAKLTSEGLHMAREGFSVPDDTAALMSSFAKAFFTLPMHVDKNITLDLPPAAVMAALIAVPILCYVVWKALIKQADAGKTVSFAGIAVRSDAALRVAVFESISAMASYGIIFLAHITIFRSESQYLDPKNMALSVSRYGAPFTIGGMLLFAGIISFMMSRAAADCDVKDTDMAANIAAGTDTYGCFHKCLMKSKRCLNLTLAVFIAAVFLCTDYAGLWKTVYGYRDTLVNDKEYIRDMHDDEGLVFESATEKYSESKRLWEHRVIYLRNSKNIHWVKDTYISADVSPIPVIYADISENEESGQLAKNVRTSHASYLYSDDAGDDTLKTLSQFTEGGEFKYGVFYRIIYEDSSFTLEREPLDER